MTQRILPTPPELAALVADLLKRLTSDDEEFTAYEITTILRQHNPLIEIPHEDWTDQNSDDQAGVRALVYAWMYMNAPGLYIREDRQYNGVMAATYTQNRQFAAQNPALPPVASSPTQKGTFISIPFGDDEV